MNGLDADVIIVGCGPVGVMAALRCAQRGLRVVAIEKATEVYPLPRALGMDDEIQDLFARAGLLDDLRANSTALLGGEFVNSRRERVVGIELPEGTTGSLGHPPVVTFDQPAVERFLREAALGAGVDMRLGVEALEVVDTTDGVEVGLGGPEGNHSLRGTWLIAADGAKSTVRALRGVRLVDQGFDQTWLVVDTTLLDPDLALPGVAQQVCDPARICTFVPGPGAHRRWEFQLHPGETREEVLTDQSIAEFLSPWGSTQQLQIDRSAVYRFHATVAERFRDGPVFLAGDAAHQMPPFNGHGMCSGMRDAENLSWKLAHVACGRADQALLDTYEEERRPHAAAQVAHSVDAGMLMQAIAHDGDAALESGYGQRPFPKLTGSLFTAGHDLIGSLLPAPAAPAPPLGDEWTVLTGPDGAGSVLRPWTDSGVTVTAVSLDAYPGVVTDKMAVVVRPDRYVAAITSDLAEAVPDHIRRPREAHNP